MKINLNLILLLACTICFLAESEAVAVLNVIIGVIKTADLVRKAKLAYHMFASKHTDLYGQIRNVYTKIEHLESMLSQSKDIIIEKMLNDLPHKINIDAERRVLNDIEREIDYRYRFYNKYTERPDLYNNFTLVEFSKDLIDTNYGLPMKLEKIQAKYLEVMTPLMDQTKIKPTPICGFRQSPQALVIYHYSEIFIYYLKGVTMIKFAYMILQSGGYGTFDREIQDIDDTILEHLEKVHAQLIKDVGLASREIWNCDPDKHVKGETYEVVNIFQNFITNVADLDQSNFNSMCSRTCDDYAFTRLDANKPCKSEFCKHPQGKCLGTVMNCKPIEDFSVCYANDGNRRLDYIQFDNGYVNGKKDRCNLEMMSQDTWNKLWLPPLECGFCVCTCEDRLRTNHYFGLSPVLSDVKNNMAITGLHLRRVNDVFVIQIQQGKLIANNTIDEESVEWLPIKDNFTVYHPQKGFNTSLIPDKDYFKIDAVRNKIMLDEFLGIPTFIMTGIKFTPEDTVRPANSKALRLSIQLTAYWSETGQIYPETSSWYSNKDTHWWTSKEKNLNEPDQPIEIDLKSVPDSDSSQYVRFQTTSMLKDVGQTTVPFLDVQPVVTEPPVPLSGVGIFHKGQPGSGGFIALKAFTAPL